jgi:two-component system CheB/CheR fusion protein
LLHVPTHGESGVFTGAVGVDSHTGPVHWSDGDALLCRIVGNALHGITERKRAFDGLVREKQFSERLIDSLPGLFYLYDSDLRLRRWNSYHETVMGFSPEDLRGKRMEDWLGTPEHRDEVLAAARNILERGDAVDFLETEVLHKDGTLTPYLVSGARVDSPTGPMLVGVGFDIAARLRAERALAESERNYRELFNATNDALVIYDEAGRVLDVNARACAMFGFDAARARQLTVADLCVGEPPDSGRAPVEKIRRAMRDGPQVYDCHSKRGDGTSFWSETAMRASQIGGKERVIASVRDITERKLAALERERLMAEAQAASSAKDQFLAVLSHELRNPLAAIQASAGMIRRLAPGDDPRVVRGMEIIERNVKLQARLVDDLLDLSRLVRGKLTIRRAPVQLDDVVLAAVQACRDDAARAGVALEARAASGLWIDADADRIQQVVLNLVGNGIKFTPRDGRVKVAVVAKDDRYGRITVDDAGVGIEPDRLADLFEMFQQGEVAARRAPGLGIGLALVKSLVELHGGRVWAESAGRGRGSRFTVELPLCPAPIARGAPEVPSPGHAPLRMLLVEDNADTRAMLAESLGRFGYNVVTAESAEAALEILAREPVDVILADIGLPGMDGYEFLRRARRQTAAAHAFAFALTGYGQDSDRRRAREAGYVDHFVKPVDVEEIDRRIRSHVPPVRE